MSDQQDISMEYLEPLARCGCGGKVQVEYFPTMEYIAEFWRVRCVPCGVQITSMVSEPDVANSWNRIVGRSLRIAIVDYIRYLSYHYLEDTKLDTLYRKLELELADIFDPEVAIHMRKKLEKE